MPKIDLSKASVRTACVYPGELADHCKGRSKVALGDLGGLDQFGVNLTRLAPGAASAHRHWHLKEDELVYMLEGEAVLVEDGGETVLRPGDVATFKAGVANGHMMVNRSGADAVFLEIGTRSPDEISSYTDPEVDLKMIKENGGWTPYRKNGEKY
ncbi:cupin domain-containing protein [Hyphococcus sp.]|uniref:cupin domain-containing protein n=1 Tax=Hyphococcus sp. TaxID=2038636 RepID=UPI003D0A5B63